MIDSNTLLRFIRILSDLSNQIRNATQKRVLLEVGFIKLCTPQMETDTESLLERLHQLEQKMAEGIPVAAAPATVGPAGLPAGSPSPETPSASPSSPEEALRSLEERFSPAETEDLKKIAANWNSIVSQTGMPMQKFLQSARIAVSEDSSVIKLIFENNDIGKSYFERDHQHNLGILSEIVAQQTGKSVKFECLSQEQTIQTQSNYIDLSKIHQTVIFE